MVKLTKSPVKNSSPKKKVVVEEPKKRKAPVEAESDSDDEEIDFKSIINDESDSEDEIEGDTVFESADEEVKEDDSEDSDDEYNKLLAEAEGDDEDEDEDEDEESEESEDEPNEFSGSISNRLRNVKIRSLSQGSESEELIHTKYSDGKPRIIRPEINPVYDSDDSDQETGNTIGNIPISAYDQMPHICYDINGKRIMRPAKGSLLDQLLESIELPEGWTGLLDQNTGSSLNLTEEELNLIAKIQRQEQTDESTNPYEPTIEWFTSQTELMPLTAVPEPKRRFVPSKHEAKRIMKIVRAIREGRIIPPDQVQKQAEEESKNFDLWANQNDDHVDHIMTLRAPKLPPPTNEESYNPPEEYLLDEQELEEYLKKDPSERDTNFIPQKFKNLRSVVSYSENIRERFERSLDLYLAPRVRKNKLNIDPESLIPELPSPRDLRPFPIHCSTVYEGHRSRIRTLSIDPTGLWLATGSDDGSVKVWEILTGRQVYSVQLLDVDEEPEDHIEDIEWNPSSEVGLLAVACGDVIYLIVPPIFGYELENLSRLKIENGFGYKVHGQKVQSDIQNAEDDDDEVSKPKSDVTKWVKPTKEQSSNGIVLLVQCKKNIKKLSWHRKGDYFVTVSSESSSTSVLIHQVSKHVSQSPFKKSKGIIMDAKFHPFKPQLFICSQRYVRIYDLSQQILVKKLMPGARWLSSIDIHPRGDNLLLSSFDKRVLWHDLDLSATPYKTLRYHEKALRSVQFHKGSLPLFASASDDGSIHVFHGMVYDDLMTNPLLVPLKKLMGHKITNSLGVLDLVWHPREAWLFSAGADGTARLWTT